MFGLNLGDLSSLNEGVRLRSAHALVRTHPMSTRCALRKRYQIGQSFSGVILFVFALLTGCSAPTAEQLADNFHTSETAFSRTVEIFQEGIQQQSLRLTNENSLALEQLSDQLDVRNINYASKCEILLIAHTQASGSIRTDKGYAYLCAQLALLVADIDRLPAQTEEYFIAYQHLQDEWYLFVQTSLHR
jgi:hypothetical protein